MKMRCTRLALLCLGIEILKASKIHGLLIARNYRKFKSNPAPRTDSYGVQMAKREFLDVNKRKLCRLSEHCFKFETDVFKEGDTIRYRLS